MSHHFDVNYPNSGRSISDESFYDSLISHSFRVARKSQNWRIRIAESFMRSSGKEKKVKRELLKRNENQILESILKTEAFKRPIRDPLTTPSTLPWT